MSSQKLNIIVQAGGRGSRLRHHTWNKPKCLVSYNGKPILYHLFDQYKDAHFIIIGDYAFDQLERYLQINPPDISYILLKTEQKGTAAGIGDALRFISNEENVMLIWSDLILKEKIIWLHSDLPIVAITSAFTCRWSVNFEGALEEKPSGDRGIPGVFYFPKRGMLENAPNSGEFVRWFSENVKKYFIQEFTNMEELGEFVKIEQGNEKDGFSRFFNNVLIDDKYVTKEAIDSRYASVHENEIAWYKDAHELGFRRIPKIVSLKPLKMEKIFGQHPFLLSDLNMREQRAVLADTIDTLIGLHDTASTDSRVEDINEVYFSKTISRVESVSPLIPGFDRDYVTVNGRRCKNYFTKKNVSSLKTIIQNLAVKEFCPIHGDPTFSNTLVDDYLRVWFIDPRGYFARPGIFGDAWYDFAKVYYSAMGGYDLFNRRKFKLHIDADTVEILMQESNFSRVSSDVFSYYFPTELPRIKIIHGLIWLSLSGYVRDDIDSVIGSFYFGLYWLEGAISGL